MKKKAEDKFYKEVTNFRELVKRYEEFEELTAFKYKEKGEIKEISYKKFVEDIKKAA